MHDRAILALAFASTLVFAGSSLACEMHQSHVNLTTAAVQPASPPPPPEPQAQTVQPSPVVSEDAASAVSKRYDTGFINCPRMRVKEQTVYLTD
jgi:hypothetical protein